MFLNVDLAPAGGWGVSGRSSRDEAGIKKFNIYVRYS